MREGGKQQQQHETREQHMTVTNTCDSCKQHVACVTSVCAQTPSQSPMADTANYLSNTLTMPSRRASSSLSSSDNPAALSNRLLLLLPCCVVVVLERGDPSTPAACRA